MVTVSGMAQQMADEERELLEAEQGLLLSVDENRARAALVRAAEVRLRADF